MPARIFFWVASAFVLGALLLGSATGQQPNPQQPQTTENPSSPGITTATDFTYLPEETLPPVRGVSGYHWDNANKVVVFPINLWIGWAPIIMANGGLAPNSQSVFYQTYGFKVDLRVIDDPIAARDAFAAGESHILWGTLDMMVLFSESLAEDSRTALRIFQQIDWSNGGDGIVARGDIRTINDLAPQGSRRRVVALAQSSPSHYYLLNLLYYAGISPEQIEFRFTGDAFQAAAAFVNDPSVDACVSWSPDIYRITDPQTGVRGAHLISSTADAKRVIADVWGARADFANDHPDVITGLVRGIFDGMEMLNEDPATGGHLFEQAFGLPEGEAQAMLHDAHITNWIENREFFLNQNNPTNFRNTWENITNIYRLTGYVQNTPVWNQVADPRVVRDSATEYQANAYHARNSYADESFAAIQTVQEAEAGQQILTRTVRIQFRPNADQVDYTYDTNAEAVIREVGRMAGQFGSSNIVIIGHTDRSMYERAQSLGQRYLEQHSERARDLSRRRAQAVLDRILADFPDFRATASEKFFVDGMGWDRPLATDALSRRVEIRVLTPEQ